MSKRVGAWRLAAVAMGAVLSFGGAAQAQDKWQRAWDVAWPDRPRMPAFADAVAPDSPNAAGRYAWLFQELDPRLGMLAGQLPAEELTLQLVGEDGPSKELRARLIVYQDWIEPLIEATKIERFDLFIQPLIHLDIAETDPRHLFWWTALRSANVLKADAIRCRLEGEHDKSVERIAALLRFTSHMSKDSSLLFHQLNAASLLERCEETIELIGGEGQPPFTPAQRQELLKSLDGFDMADPAHLRAGWESHVKAHREFVQEQLNDGNVGEPLALLLLQTKGVKIVADEIFKNVEGKDLWRMAPDERQQRIAELLAHLEHPRHDLLIAELKGNDELVARIQAIWKEPDAEKRLNEMANELSEDPSGLKAATSLSTVHWVHRQWRESVARLAKLKSTLAEEPAAAK